MSGSLLVYRHSIVRYIYTFKRFLFSSFVKKNNVIIKIQYIYTESISFRHLISPREGVVVATSVARPSSLFPLSLSPASIFFLRSFDVRTDFLSRATARAIARETESSRARRAADAAVFFSWEFLVFMRAVVYIHAGSSMMMMGSCRAAGG